MARNKTAVTIRLTLAASLSVLLAACASSVQQQPVAVDRPEVLVDFDKTGLTDQRVQDAGRRAYIDPANLRPDAPTEYTVIEGDTLWAISGRYLNEPWLWTKLWESNKHIENPHLIYPGDKIELQYIDGLPTILLSQHGLNAANGPQLGAANAEPALDEFGNPMALYTNQRIKVSPIVRSEPIASAIPTISGDSIQQFLIHPLVADIQTLENAPYVVANDEGRLASTVGSNVYARGEINGLQTRYGVYRKNAELRDPESGRPLGFELTHVADAALLERGDPATLVITRNKMETSNGDILLSSAKSEAIHRYLPRLPKLSSSGRVVSLSNAISQSGRNQVVVLNLGEDSSIKAGDVLAIESRGRSVIDHRRSSYDRVELPNVRTGVVMVFKTFEKHLICSASSHNGCGV